MKPNNILINDFAFSEDGTQVYMNGYGNGPNLTELNWMKNKIYTTWIKTSNKNNSGYIRSVAAGKGQVYINVHKAKEIIVINNKTGTKQSLAINYVPILFKTSPNRETLYTLGYISSEGKTTYFLHKYTNLKYLDAESGTITNPSDFYKGFGIATMTYPNEVRPSNMEISPDEKWAFITTAKGGSYGETGGTDLLIYDLKTMKEFKRIKIPYSGWEISIANEKINYDPELKLDLTVALPNSVFGLIKKFEIIEVTPTKNSFVEDFDNGLIVTATFTKNLDKTTINNSTFKITQIDGNEIIGKITIIDNKLIFESTNPLESGKEYKAFISNTIKSNFGETINSPISWTFNTKLDYNNPQKIVAILPSIKIIGHISTNITITDNNITDNNNTNNIIDNNNNTTESESNQNNENLNNNVDLNIKVEYQHKSNQEHNLNTSINTNTQNEIKNEYDTQTKENIDSNTNNQNNTQTNLIKSIINWILSFFK